MRPTSGRRAATPASTRATARPRPSKTASGRRRVRPSSSDWLSGTEAIRNQTSREGSVIPEGRAEGELVPAHAGELVELDVAAAQHADDCRAGLGVHQAVQERRHRRGGRTLDDDLRPRERPEQGLEDLLVRKRDDLVDVPAHDLQRLLADTLDSQPVDHAVDLFELDQLTLLDAALHRGRAGRFDSNYSDLWVERLQCGGDSRDQPAAADRN